MTPDEAIQFGNALPEPSAFERAQMLHNILGALEEAATPKVLRAARKILLDNAESFRRADAPGHATWYEHHLRAAAEASMRWELKAAGLSYPVS